MSTPFVQHEQPPPPPIPVTMLSGFLGAGKTTLLKYILENSSIKIACIVNDLASVNIDAKLVRNSTSRSAGMSGNVLSDMVELQNGCACCSAADELFPAFAELVMMGQKNGCQYDRFILENSGVAEPQNIRDSFNEAAAMGHPITSRIELDSFLTVVDASTFIMDFSSKVPISMRPDLGDGMASFRPVVDLLVEQIECADVIVLNKADTLDPEKIQSLKPVIASMNPLAHVSIASFGKIPLELIHRSGIAAKMNIEAQHRSAVMAAKEKDHQHQSPHQEHGHDHHGHQEHGHDHHGHQEHDHDHHGHQEHDHDHHGHQEHDHHHHGHQEHDHHHHGHQEHDHHHHGHQEHDHHHHGHRSDPSTRFGITSFVYLRRRPFHPLRLRQLVLRWLPATTNTALEGEQLATGDSPIRRVLRSKGFTWLANSHLSAFYWSHAGQHFEMREEGDWWVTIHPEGFPPDPRQKKIIYEDFDPSGRFGDRRQEIVFIGSNMNKEGITQQLDSALLTDQELEQYVENWSTNADPQHPDMLFFQEGAKNNP